MVILGVTLDAEDDDSHVGHLDAPSKNPKSNLDDAQAAVQQGDCMSCPPWHVDDDEEGHYGDGDVGHVKLLPVSGRSPLMEDLDPPANADVEDHQDDHRGQSRRRERMQLENMIMWMCTGQTAKQTFIRSTELH